MTHTVTNLHEPYHENLHDPIPWPIYMSRTVKIYVARSVSNLRVPYREHLHDPYRDQFT